MEIEQLLKGVNPTYCVIAPAVVLVCKGQFGSLYGENPGYGLIVDSTLRPGLMSGSPAPETLYLLSSVRSASK